MWAVWYRIDFDLKKRLCDLQQNFTNVQGVVSGTIRSDHITSHLFQPHQADQMLDPMIGGVHLI